jgi:hypothetical protein
MVVIVSSFVATFGGVLVLVRSMLVEAEIKPYPFAEIIASPAKTPLYAYLRRFVQTFHPWRDLHRKQQFRLEDFLSFYR